ncbi:MAG: prolipoprotein diacylglyceryl transferase, partial [Bdellovibrionales bacterium]|nr:prolipoprotein diacylglyceryl transferase [Bdellovibrionales bacterium]
MLPYLQIPPFELLGLKFHLFGLLVALGFIMGSRMALLYIKRHQLKIQPIHDAATLCLVFGFIGAHLFHVLAYEPESLKANPIRLLQIWSGLSSFGGFLGATLALTIYFKIKKIRFLPYADGLMFGLLVGWVFGRLGCFTAHDHPGQLSDFFLAVQYPGGARHDLGLYEAISTALLLVIFLVLWKKGFNRIKGFLLFSTSGLYSLIRFSLDFLRAHDSIYQETRYFSLTPAQYASIVLFFVSVIYCLHLWKKQGSY